MTLQNSISPYCQESPHSDSKAVRNSSVEVFRILATFLVLIAHFNGWFVGGIPKFDGEEVSAFRIGQLFIGSLCACCVNCFLVISGWYGIRLKWKTIWNINWMLLCVYVPFYVVRCFITHEFRLYTLLTCFFGVLRESYFIQCYLMVMFLSPVLNVFIEKYGRKILPYVLCFWGIEFFAEVIGNQSLGINEGYSVIHFVLMYMLARTASLYKKELMKVKRHKWIIGYFVCALILCGMHIFGVRWIWNYSNPVVILSAFCLFMPFLYRTYYNRKINWIAGSTLAVYIMHVCSPLIDVLRRIDNHMLQNYSYALYLFGAGFVILLVFGLCVVYDKIRIWATGGLSEKMFVEIKSRLTKYQLSNE